VKVGTPESPSEAVKASLPLRRLILLTCVRFALAYAILVAGASLIETTLCGRALIHVTAAATAWGLRLFGLTSQVMDTMVLSPGVHVEIIYECTAIFPVVLFLAAVLTFPARMPAKLAGIAIGLPAIFFLNQARLLSLVFVLSFAPSYYEDIHLIVWPSLLVLVLTGGWLVWARRALPSYDAP
jgi:exosortase/archaeosortase family protein